MSVLHQSASVSKLPGALSSSSDDPILPSLRSVAKCRAEYHQDPNNELALQNYRESLRNCILKFADEPCFWDDHRFLRILDLYGATTQDFGRIFSILDGTNTGLACPILYEFGALFLISKGKLLEAHRVFKLAFSRNVESDNLKRMYTSFLQRLPKFVGPAAASVPDSYVYPWSDSTINVLLKKVDSQLIKYNGYFKSSKIYSGKVSLSSLQKASRNKMIELGKRNYLLKGCSGQGAFASVFKAFVDNNPEDIVALKLQKPPFPWEFYMYRQLDYRIPKSERQNYGFSESVHIYSDWSILVCDYIPHGTLQDAINSYIVLGKCMEELLCIHYTIEMLRILETLHSVGIIHGDFKPDNLLIRYSRDDLTEVGYGSTGPWLQQGLCLVDWGRGIDLNLFPLGTEFKGSCRTSGFCCVQMQEQRPWTFQVDTYGLCVAVHMMLHGQYMSIEKATSDVGVLYQPKSTFKRYWNVALWKNLFNTLLNMESNEKDTHILRILRKTFEDYICQEPRLIWKLKDLLARQKVSLCSA